MREHRIAVLCSVGHYGPAAAGNCGITEYPDEPEAAHQRKRYRGHQQERVRNRVECEERPAIVPLTNMILREVSCAINTAPVLAAELRVVTSMPAQSFAI